MCVCLVAQSSLTLCDPMDYSPPGSSVHGILQARTLCGLLVPFSGDLPNPGIELGSPELQADSLPSEPPGEPKPGWFGLKQTQRNKPLKDKYSMISLI